MPEVLVAAHIIPVYAKGKDVVQNGICLRSDIHILFDTGHLRLHTNGNIRLTERTSLDVNYGSLPSRIIIPAFVKQSLKWRWEYC